LLHVVLRPDAFFLIATTVCPPKKTARQEIALAGAGLDEAAVKQFPTWMKPFWRLDAKLLKPLPRTDAPNDTPNWRARAIKQAIKQGATDV
jgi:hypothetical protein